MRSATLSVGPRRWHTVWPRSPTGLDGVRRPAHRHRERFRRPAGCRNGRPRNGGGERDRGCCSWGCCRFGTCWPASAGISSARRSSSSGGSAANWADLPPSPFRRRLAGFQMGLLAVVPGAGYRTRVGAPFDARARDPVSRRLCSATTCWRAAGSTRTARARAALVARLQGLRFLVSRMSVLLAAILGGTENGGVVDRGLGACSLFLWLADPSGRTSWHLTASTSRTVIPVWYSAGPPRRVRALPPRVQERLP